MREKLLGAVVLCAAAAAYLAWRSRRKTPPVIRFVARAKSRPAVEGDGACRRGAQIFPQEAAAPRRASRNWYSGGCPSTRVEE